MTPRPCPLPDPQLSGLTQRQMWIDARLDRPMAEFSPCRTWRYILRRRWSAKPPIGFILLNPSTADDTKDDPTIRRCIGFAKAAGAGGLVLGNLFAFRATDPREMRGAFDPIGPANNESLMQICKEVDFAPIICGWGSHGSFRDRGKEVTRLLYEWRAYPMALTLTKAGDPGHPLYLPASLKPFEIGPDGARIHEDFPPGNDGGATG